MNAMRRLNVFFLGVLMILPAALLAQDDPYLWLEEVQGDKALAWVKQQNAASTAELEAVPGFAEIRDKLLAILNSKERIPYVTKYKDFLYNFWQDAGHPRGIWRRTTLEEYRKSEPAWETVLDIDALAKQENENWVYKGIQLLYPDYQRGLLQLSRGGGDAVVIREFDVSTRSFVKDGFDLPEAKARVSWIDPDHIFVGTDFGPGSLTDSGYPRQVKRWKRGTPLAQAELMFETDTAAVSASGFRMFSRDGHFDILFNMKTFYEYEYYILQNGKPFKLDIPKDAALNGYFRRQIFFQLKSDWTRAGKVLKQGSLIYASLEQLLAGKPEFKVLIEPGERMSIAGTQATRNTLLVTVLENVTSRLFQYTQNEQGEWKRQDVAIEKNSTVSVSNTDEDSDNFFLSFQNFLTPSTLFRVDGKDSRMEKLKSLPALFDATPYTSRQFEAVSKDGTRIPYFTVMKKDTAMDGKNPVLLNAYGGFEVSQVPSYMSGSGPAWLDRGGVYVLANLRGGGEFGPRWHQAGMLKNRHKVYEDLIAVAEDLCQRKITSPGKLAIQGGSNGGLLVGAAFTLRPDLFKAVVCQVPLLDMQRYHKLLAGASWMAEYGNPDDPDMWSYMKDYSPYHILRKDVKYPKVFFSTSTRDDRVHPAHARKMVARMLEFGHPLYYYENVEGGHSLAANLQQRAYMGALAYAYLYKMLMNP